LNTIFVFLIFITNCYSQSTSWQRNYDGIYHDFDEGEDVCESGNDNIFIVGASKIPNSYGTINVLKINRLGDTIWTKNFGYGWGQTVVSTGDGGCILTGQRNGSFTLKIDSSGSIIWDKTYNDSMYFSGNDIIRTSDSGYLICGTSFNDFGYLFKIDINGNLQWDTLYTGTNLKNFNKVVEAFDGGYLILGISQGLILKIDLLGNIVWVKNAASEWNSRTNNIVKSNNQYVISGDFNDGSFKAFIKRLDLNGEVLFTKVFQSLDNESLNQLALINNNKYILSIYKTTSTIPYRHYQKLILIDSSGNILTQKNYYSFGDLVILSILPLTNSDIVFVGYAECFPFPVQEDVYVIRTDSLLNAPPPISISNNQLTIPSNYKLLQNYPNPFNPLTKIKFDIPKSSAITLKVFDILGREVYKLSEFKNAGQYELNIDGSNLPSGLYFYSLEANGFMDVKKMVLLK
jgi:hypothetical protein